MEKAKARRVKAKVKQTVEKHTVARAREKAKQRRGVAAKQAKVMAKAKGRVIRGRVGIVVK